MAPLQYKDGLFRYGISITRYDSRETVLSLKWELLYWQNNFFLQAFITYLSIITFWIYERPETLDIYTWNSNLSVCQRSC